jgi:hypothetical protein
MRILKVIVVSCFFALAFAANGPSTRADFATVGMGSVRAQIGAGMLGQAPQPRGIFNPIVGSGAQYEYQSTGKEKRTLEIVVVGKEAVEGKDGYWVETTMPGTPMGDVVAKALMIFDGSTATIEKMVMQMPGAPPMDMSAQMGRAGAQKNGQKETIDIRDKADKVGSESVTTPAGTFNADHYRMKDGTGDFWISDKVSPYGVIKGEGRDQNMMLVKVVTDAKDKITGTPVPFNPMLLMQRGQGGRPQQ